MNARFKYRHLSSFRERVMKLGAINSETIKEFDKIKAGVYRPALSELYVYSYLREKYDLVIEHGSLDFLCIDWDKREVHIYEVKGRNGKFSKRQEKMIYALLKIPHVKVFLVYPDRISESQVTDTIETPFGYLFIIEITQENLPRILTTVGVKKH